MKLSSTLSVLLLAALCSCEAAPRAVRKYVVMFDGDGEPVDPSGNPLGRWRRYAELGDEFPVYVEQNVIAGLERWVQEGERRRIVIFFHGGMNTQVGSVDRATKLSPRIMCDGRFSAYPIFVNWQSSLTSSYRDHLLFVRRGNDFGGLATILAPFYFVADVGRMVLRAPIVTIEGLYRSVQTLVPGGTKEQRIEKRLAETLSQRDSDDPNGYSFFHGEDRRGTGEWLWGKAKWILTLPTRVVGVPVLDAFGTPAWNTMLRRVDLLVEREEQSHEGYSTPGHRSDLLWFFERLGAFLEENDPSSWDVVLIGHSMGAIVINRVLSYATRTNAPFPRFTHIVYMAPACTLGDFERSVVPYLHQRWSEDVGACTGDPDATAVPSCRFHLLTLHPTADLDEEYMYGFAPRGSLLLWLDDYFNVANSEADHMLGRSANAITFLHRVPGHLLPYIGLKVFHHGSSTEAFSPQNHGDFASFPFWRDSFWATSPPPGCDLAAERLADPECRRDEQWARPR